MNKTIMLEEIKSQPEKLKQCYEKNKDIIPLIAKTIKSYEPNNIILVGRGTSLHSAYYAKYLFEIYYEIPVSIASPSVFTVYNRNLKMDKTLVIAISQSGKGKDIFEVVKKANEKGALTLSITNNEKSIVAIESKYDLYNNVDEAVAYAATKTYTSTIYLLTKLIYELTGVAELDLDENRVYEALENSLKYYDQIKEDVKTFKDKNQLISIARGYNFGLASELSLKLKEGSHMQADAFASSEFYHGPIVMATNKEIPIVLFAIDKVTNKNIDDLIKELKKMGSYTYVITNIGDILNNADNGINILEDNDLYAMFTAIGIMQLFACELSVIKGFNPDFVDVLEHIDTI